MKVTYKKFQHYDIDESTTLLYRINFSEHIPSSHLDFIQPYLGCFNKYKSIESVVFMNDFTNICVHSKFVIDISDEFDCDFVEIL